MKSALLVFCTVTLASVVGCHRSPIGAPAGYVEMSVVAVERWPDVVVLGNAEGARLRIYVGRAEAEAIRLRWRKKKSPRPMTHDLLDSVLKEYRGKMVKAQVDALRGNVFHGSVFVLRENQVVPIDSRPSDGIALALGSDAPIYVARKVLEEAPRHTGLDAPSVEER